MQSIKGLEDDHNGMFKRLEQKFGKHIKFMDLILNNLRILKPLLEGDDKGLIRTIVERCYLDENELGSSNEGWDDPIREGYKQRWKHFLRIYKTGELQDQTGNQTLG